MNEWVVVDPNICAGKPAIRGTRIMVGNILNLLAHGATEDEVLTGYPQLTQADIHAALEYAEALVNDEEVLPTFA